MSPRRGDLPLHSPRRAAAPSRLRVRAGKGSLSPFQADARFAHPAAPQGRAADGVTFPRGFNSPWVFHVFHHPHPGIVPCPTAEISEVFPAGPRGRERSVPCGCWEQAGSPLLQPGINGLGTNLVIAAGSLTRAVGWGQRWGQCRWQGGTGVERGHRALIARARLPAAPKDAASGLR